jgi:hypothetical protein
MIRIPNIFIFKRLVLLTCLLFIGIRFYSGLALNCLAEPKFIFVSADNTYWILHLLNIPQLLLTKPFDLIFDILFILCFVLQIIWVKNRTLTAISIFLTALYAISFNSALGNQNHTMVGIFFIQIPLVYIHDTNRFVILMAGLRYYFIFIYVSSGFWKIFRGNLFDDEKFYQVFFSQNIDRLSDNNHFLSLFNPLIYSINLCFQNLIWISLILFQFCLGVGFFTRKFDFFICLSIFVFHLIAAIFFNVFMSFFPVIILFFSFFVLITDQSLIIWTDPLKQKNI